jgi:hypothetical protein
MLLAPPINADRGDQDQFVADVQAVDLDRQQIEFRQVAGQPPPELRIRQGDELPPTSRCRRPRATRHHRPAAAPSGGTSGSRQHLVHRPLAEPVLILRRRPTRQHQFLLALTAANPRAVHPDPTPMKGDLAPGLAPPPALPPVMPLMALTADRRSFLL